MKNNLCPNYLSSLIPPNIGSSVRYNLRNVSDTRNTQLYYNSFLPSAIREWNGLPCDIQDSSTVVSFKTRLNSNIALPPPYYSTGNRLDQIHHTRLQLHCSSLNQHLFSKNIIPNPLCTCGEIEDTRHYLLNCIRYRDIRQEMLTTVSSIFATSLNVLLFGNATLLRLESIIILLLYRSLLRNPNGSLDTDSPCILLYHSVTSNNMSLR